MHNIFRLSLCTLGVASLLCLGGCGKDVSEFTPFEIYQRAYAGLSAEQAVAYDVEAFLDVYGSALADSLGNVMLDGISLEINADIRQVKSTDATYDMAADIDMQVLFVDIGADAQLYLADGYLYCSVPEADIAYKMALPDEGGWESRTLIVDPAILTEDMLASSSFDSDGDTVKLVLAADKINEQITLLAPDSAGTIVVDEASIAAEVDENGNMTLYKADVDMQIGPADEAADIRLQFTADITTGDDIVVSLPDDLAAYVEIPLQDY